MKRIIYIFFAAVLLIACLTACMPTYVPVTSSTTEPTTVKLPSKFICFEEAIAASCPTGLDVSTTIDNILVGEPLLSHETYSLMELDGKTYIRLDYSYETMEKASIQNGVISGGGKMVRDGTEYTIHDTSNIGQLSPKGLSFNPEYIRSYSIKEGRHGHTRPSAARPPRRGRYRPPPRPRAYPCFLGRAPSYRWT